MCIGSQPSCSCAIGKRVPLQELCIHILFVTVRVMRVPTGNPIVWQLSLIDRELDEVLRCAEAPTRFRAPLTLPPSDPAPGLAPGEVLRREVDEDETCPICYEDLLGVSTDDLVYCKWSCGRNIHGRCMRVWSDHQASLARDLSCPLCRQDCGEFLWTPAFKPHLRAQKHERASHVHYGVSCAKCREVRPSSSSFSFSER